MGEINASNDSKKTKEKATKPGIFSKAKGFNQKDYFCLVEKEETVERQVIQNNRLKTVLVPTGNIIEVEKLRPDYIQDNLNEDIAKCRLRAAKAFDCSVNHLKEGYRLLNGKKLDGFYVTSLIDRFGFSGGSKKAINRDILAQKYENKTVYSVDVAQEKLKQILASKDIVKAFMDTVKDVKESFENDLKEKTVYGQ